MARKRHFFYSGLFCRMKLSVISCLPGFDIGNSEGETNTQIWSLMIYNAKKNTQKYEIYFIKIVLFFHNA